MSNPFAKTYEDLRKPYLEGKMAKKDYDGDGKIESGTDEYMGSRDKAIKKAMGKKVTKEHHQKDADGNVIPHGDGTPSSVEEEQINELSKKTLNQYTYDAASEGGREKGIKMASKKLGKAKSARTVRKQKEDEAKGREVGHSRQEGPYRDANKSAGKPRQPYNKYMKKDKAAAEKRAKASGGFGNRVTYGEDNISYTAAYLDELSKKTLGGYVKKASKEARGNMVATQHGSGIPKKAKDIKLKQVNKRMKGIEKAGEKLAKEETLDEIKMPKNTSYEKMSYKKLKNTHGDFKNMDSKPPRVAVLDKKTGGTVSKPVKFVPDKKPKSKMKEEFAYLEKHLEIELASEGTLGTLHVADMKGNTPAWQNRMGLNKKGKRLYSFGQDLIQKLSYEYPDDMKMIEAKDTSAMKKYLDAKAKRLTKEKEAQKPEYKNNPAFGDPSHHSNRKNRKETFSDWRSDFIWEDGDSVKKT